MSGIDFQGETEQSLVAALQQGKQDMLAKLYDAYAPLMMGVITRIVHHNELAEQVLQETFVAIWERIGIYNPAKDRLLIWGVAIARGIALEAVRSDRYAAEAGKANMHQLNGNQPNKNVPLQQSSRAEQEICNLPPLEKKALELLYLKGRSCSETAAELNMSTDALKTILVKAFTLLKAEKTV